MNALGITETIWKIILIFNHPFPANLPPPADANAYIMQGERITAIDCLDAPQNWGARNREVKG